MNAIAGINPIEVQVSHSAGTLYTNAVRVVTEDQGDGTSSVMVQAGNASTGTHTLAAATIATARLSDDKRDELIAFTTSHGQTVHVYDDGQVNIGDREDGVAVLGQAQTRTYSEPDPEPEYVPTDWGNQFGEDWNGLYENHGSQPAPDPEPTEEQAPIFWRDQFGGEDMFPPADENLQLLNGDRSTVEPDKNKKKDN